MAALLALAFAAAGQAQNAPMGARFGSVHGLMGRAVGLARETDAAPGLVMVHGRSPATSGRRELWAILFTDAERRTYERIEFYDGEYADPCEKLDKLAEETSCRRLRRKPQQPGFLSTRACGLLSGDFVDSAVIEESVRGIGLGADRHGQYELVLLNLESVSACVANIGLYHLAPASLRADPKLRGKSVWIAHNGREAAVFSAKDGRLIRRYAD